MTTGSLRLRMKALCSHMTDDSPGRLRWIWIEDLLLVDSHISWLTTDFWKSGTSEYPLANKPCSSWMKWNSILKDFEIGLPSRSSLSLSLSICLIWADKLYIINSSYQSINEPIEKFSSLCLCCQVFSKFFFFPVIDILLTVHWKWKAIQEAPFPDSTEKLNLNSVSSGVSPQSVHFKWHNCSWWFFPQ